MPRGRKTRKAPIPTNSRLPLQPTLHLLERFSASDLETWKRRSSELDQLHQLLFYGLEPERIRRRAEIIEALNSRPAEPFDFDGWTRVVEYKFSDRPLSSAGSVIGIGGRFNVGNGCDAYPAGSAVPALYLGDSQATAFREFYQCEADAAFSGLTREEISLRRSDAAVRLSGHVERVFDMRNIAALIPVAKVLSKFSVPAELEAVAKSLKLGPAINMLIRTPARLRDQLQEINWRSWPIQFGLPSPSQRFGEFVAMAGYEAIRYASVKNPGGSCIALFPSNIGSTRTFVELMDDSPASVEHTRLDSTTASALAGYEFIARGAGPRSVN